MRTKIEPSQKSVSKSVSLEPNVLRAARIRAAQLDMSFSKYIAELVTSDIGKKNLKAQ